MARAIDHVRKELATWAANKPSPVLALAGIIDANLHYLAKDPSDEVLQELTKNNVARLAAMTGKSVSFASDN